MGVGVAVAVAVVNHLLAVGPTRNLITAGPLVEEQHELT